MFACVCVCWWTTAFLRTRPLDHFKLSTEHLLLQCAFILMSVEFQSQYWLSVGFYFHLFLLREKQKVLSNHRVATRRGLERIGDQLVHKDLHLRLFVSTGIDMLFFFRSIWNCVCVCAFCLSLHRFNFLLYLLYNHSRSQKPGVFCLREWLCFMWIFELATINEGQGKRNKQQKLMSKIT